MSDRARPNPAYRHPVAAALAAGLITLIWLLLLANWLTVKPGSMLTERGNVLFHSDSALFLQRITDDEAPRLRSFENLAHPGLVRVWRPVCRLLVALFSTFLPAERSAVLAAKVMVASFAAFGTACLCLVAFMADARWRYVGLALVLYLLFSSNVLVALPEHFGLSNGLLATAWAVPQLLGGASATLISLVVLAALAGATTVTNALFPLAAGVQVALKPSRLGLSAALAVLLLGLVVIFAIAETPWGVQMIDSAFGDDSREVRRFVKKFLNHRIAADPPAAGLYALAAFFLPAIGPEPHFTEVYKGTFSMVSYEPFTLADYSWIQLVGVGAWCLLLGGCLVAALRRPSYRPWAALALGWIVFNTGFHNLWGDEYFLFTPHWSWALFAILLLGIQRLPTGFVTVLSLPIVIGQIYSLVVIRRALASLI